MARLFACRLAAYCFFSFYLKQINYSKTKKQCAAIALECKKRDRKTNLSVSRVEAL